MKKTRRRARSRARLRRKRGGGMNCDAEGFTYNMKYASFGSEYNKPVGHIHSDGERWSFENLVQFTMDGRIIDWYIKKLKEQGNEFTEEEIQQIKSNEDLQILGAFFHRYKIVAERYNTIEANLNKGVAAFFPMISTNTGRDSFATVLAKGKTKGGKEMIEFVKKNLAKLAKYSSDEYINGNFVIEGALDKTQCLLYFIVKHKGNVPAGFRMDDRIKRRAYEKILIDGDVNGHMATKIDPIGKWLDFLQETSNELNDPPVTFDVFA